MKKLLFLALLFSAFLTSCVDFYNQPEEIVPEPIVETSYKLKANSSVVAVGDTIYAALSQEMLFLVTDALDVIVPIQIDFGDGTVDGGTQVLHQYKAAGIYQFQATVVGTTNVIRRVVKITSPSVTTTETIIQLSGNTVGDSAAIRLLCLKNKIYNFRVKGKYFLRGDMNNWAYAIEATDTNFVYNGAEYLLFNFKVKNYAWTSFGYYKKSELAENWGYDPNNKFWDASKGLYKFYTSGGQIYQNELTADIPGSCGDPANQKFGPTIRLNYETNGMNGDSLVIYANKKYLSGADTTLMGISYAVDGGAVVKKKARFIKNSTYFYIKLPITKSSSLSFKTYKDLERMLIGDMTSSIFYRPEIGDCYLTIAGSVQRISAVSKNGSESGSLTVITPKGEQLTL